MKLIVVENKNEIGKVVGKMFVNAVQANPKIVLGFATGSSPETTYQYLIDDYQRNNTDWSNVVSFNLDEYIGLEPTHPQSYHYFMNDKLFNHINIKKENTHVPQGTGDYVVFVKQYDEMIKKAGGIDIQLLGVGTNGHVGFNEPPADFNSLTGVVDLVESTIKANARFFDSIDQVPKQAVSMGIKSILNAKKIILIADGHAKTQAIKQLIEGEISNEWPCTSLQMHNDVTVVVDKEAAAELLRTSGITLNENK
ncbi:glucosamine-6-phosphate deaminase [Spiroplasma mirum ATCC 29335]|uniref:Glucosamine-6-phosphate deaminase n=1 Tax=Spiroplasma mirum ATCC 29335 TaxID=838561 RepID=W0GMB5_9MOLU|nr:MULTISPECIES: glucosamine-6-phosphate deaminase [Spiroplasma]AHF61327.1 glucosamine-6-phosphate deaminase [Spiroplasma mirum ATCC 29335]AHI58440.1 glucosamine-6-phosphate deaminase [Spiroplasma mirum ATCC 29335]AKM53379.1 glucosamine-6-phosphate deaminase [Spiroplasma atrichopogonis]